MYQFVVFPFTIFSFLVQCIFFLFAHIHPARGSGDLFQFVHGEFHGAVVVAGGGVDVFKLPQAFVQIDDDIFVDTEGADAAGSMTDLSFHFLEGNHFGFDMEGIFVFPVVDLCGSFGQNQHRLLFLEKGKGLGDHSGLHALLLSVGLLPENELTEELGAKMSPVTRGPLVNESMETSLSGVFACGNVLHVHDLVDFVSQEAALAGKAAAEWLKENRDKVTEADVILEQAEVKAEISGAAADTKRPAITVETGAHVRYTVPSKIRPDKAGEETLIRFRVDSVLKDHYLCVSYDGRLISHKKKRIMAPGEMEQVVIRHSDLDQYPDLARITVHIEAE